jgi:hypothetical protein
MWATFGMAVAWVAALLWTGWTTLCAIALRPDDQASALERLSRLWPLTGALPLAGLSYALAWTT